MDDAIQNMPPRYTHKKKMTPEQIEAKAAYLRKYRREWARANQKKRWIRMKERMAVDPEYREKYLEQVRQATAKCRVLGLTKKEETPEEREKRLQREREYRAKKRREYRLANPLPVKEPKSPKEEKPKVKVKTDYKRKPGRLLALAGWRGF